MSIEQNDDCCWASSLSMSTAVESCTAGSFDSNRRQALDIFCLWCRSEIGGRLSPPKECGRYSLAVSAGLAKPDHLLWFLVSMDSRDLFAYVEGKGMHLLLNPLFSCNRCQLNRA